MKGVLPITVEDLAKFKTMAVTTTPRGPSRPSSAASKLAPVEMAQPSVTFSSSGSGSLVSAGLGKPAPALPAPPGSDAPVVAYGWVVPCGYALCGTCMALCNLFVPGACLECAQLVCPLWSCTTLLHAAAQQGVWQWWGFLVVALLPFALLLGDPSFLALYAILFTLFASGSSWNALHGPLLVVVYACACAAIVSAALGVGSDHPRMHLSISGYCGTACAILCSHRLARVAFRAG